MKGQDIILNHIEYTHQTYLEDLECLKRHVLRKGYTHLVCLKGTSYHVGCDLSENLGLPLTVLNVDRTGVTLLSPITTNPKAKILVLDSVLDTGYTMDRVLKHLTGLGCVDVTGFCLYGNPNQNRVKFVRLHNGDWVNFWWESSTS